jgi:flagellar motor switch protein FliM
MWFSSGLRDDGKHDERRASLTESLMNTQIPLTAYFEQTPATVADIVNLQVGDVIKLDHALDSPLTIKVQHIPEFRATVGTLGQKYALEVVDILNEEEAQNESFAR